MAQREKKLLRWKHFYIMALTRLMTDSVAVTEKVIVVRGDR